ncbi:Yip1 family protein [Acholeplasma granularum]|uniref:Yip1 family protein n=1 Tax=Acholeplasma granularum TaxID=264635 RepID=UPI00047190BD|nr:Yip1 family protein [Acholeplasma granularum]
MFKQVKNKFINFDYVQFLKNIWEDFFKFPLYIMTHPFKGWEDLKFDKKGKYHVAIIYIFLLVITSALQITASGFLVSLPFVGNYSIVRTFFLITVPILLITLGNWSITSLFDGKGNMGEIFKVIAYAIIPLVWVGIPMTILSNFLIQEELAIYTTINSIGVFLTGYMGLFGLLVIHEYGLAKTLVTIIATIVAVAVIIFVGLLILTLFQQVFGFIDQVYNEFIMRNS